MEEKRLDIYIDLKRGSNFSYKDEVCKVTTQIRKWYFWATHSRLEPIKEAAYTIRRHWDGILKWFESRINNGILEGLNSIIQACKTKARGYRTTENFKLIAYLVTGDLKFECINPNFK